MFECIGPVPESDEWNLRFRQVVLWVGSLHPSVGMIPAWNLEI